jgi:hypothetical protein
MNRERVNVTGTSFPAESSDSSYIQMFAIRQLASEMLSIHWPSSINATPVSTLYKKSFLYSRRSLSFGRVPVSIELKSIDQEVQSFNPVKLQFKSVPSIL